mgnify:CR=1 FL=1|jgi:hypothetical protein
MILAVAPSSLLHPRAAFLAFLFVFFFPVLGSADLVQALALACGAAYFLAGSMLVRRAPEVAWPAIRPRWSEIALILGVKAVQLASNLDFDFSVTNLTAALLQSSVAQKENVAGGFVINSVLYLLLWRSLVALCAQRMLYRALLLLLVYQLLSLQTGRFLLISQLGLLIVIHHQIHRRSFNGAWLGAIALSIATLFPLLHAVRSGDIAQDVDVYSYDYVASIMAADASPGRNFLDLAEHVDKVGYNYGEYVALAPLQIVPRAIWAEKPTTSMQAFYSAAVYGLDHLDGVTFTFTIFDSYSFLGMASVALVSLAWGAGFMALFNAFLRSNRPFMRIQLALLTVNAFNFYRGNVLDFAAPIVISLVIAFLMDWLLSGRPAAPRPAAAGSHPQLV